MRTMAIAGAIAISSPPAAPARATPRSARHRGRASADFPVGALRRDRAGRLARRRRHRRRRAPSVRAEGDADCSTGSRSPSRTASCASARAMAAADWSWFSHHDRGVTVHVTVPALAGASIAGSGDMRIDRVQGPRFAGAVTGSGDLDIAALQRRPRPSFSVDRLGRHPRRRQRASAPVVSVTGSGDIDLSRLRDRRCHRSRSPARATSTSAPPAPRTSSIQGSGDVTVSGGARCTVNKAGSGDAHCDAPAATAAATAPPAPPAAPAPPPAPAGH